MASWELAEQMAVRLVVEVERPLVPTRVEAAPSPANPG
jgi:hypothetical protein